MSAPAERKPYNPYPLGVWTVRGLSPTAKAVFGCLGAHSNYLGETILGIERKDKDGELIGGLRWKTGLGTTTIKGALKEISLAGRISREDRRGTKWGRNSSRTKIWLTAEELEAAGAKDLSLYPVKTPDEILAIADANKAAAKVKSAISTVARRPMRQSQGSAGDHLKGRLAQSQGSAGDHEPLVLPSLGDLQESFEPRGRKDFQPAQGKKEKPKAKATPAGHTTALPETTPIVQGGPPPPPTPRIICRLKDEVVREFRRAGCPDSVIERLGRYTQMAAILNQYPSAECDNPVSAYATFAKRNPSFATEWLPTLKNGHYVEDDGEPDLNGDWDSHLNKTYDDALPMERLAMTPEQREEQDDYDVSTHWWLAPGRSESLKEQGRIIMKNADTFDVVAMWKAERETCDSWEARQWRKKQLALAGA